MRKDLQAAIKIPEKVEAKIEGSKITVKGPKGEVVKLMKNPKLKIELKEGSIMIIAKNGTKKEKRMMGTFEAHIRNMIRGVVEGVTYKLKICSGHFPMTAAVEKDKFVVKNFFGEKIPRTFKINSGIKVKIEGDFVLIEGVDLELAGQTAANIEQLCRITNRDRRIFQDGIYIVEKDGKSFE